MIYKATRLIGEEFRKEDLKFRIEEEDKASSVVAGYSIENGPSVSVHFTSKDDDNDVYVHMHGLLSNIAEDKRSAVMEAINECQKKYRYFKFVFYDDRSLSMEYDIPKYTSDALVGQVAVEVLFRIMNTCDVAYPILTRALWT